MSEFTLNDGRKAEKIENEVDQFTKVTEVFVEPKLPKKLSQRITERLCVCEREVETIDETTGEVLSKVVEKVCCDQASSKIELPQKSPLQMVEEKIGKEFNYKNYIFAAIIFIQLVGLLYIIFKWKNI